MVWDLDGTAGNVDTISLKADVAVGDVQLTRPWGKNDLVLSINGTTDKLTVARFFEGDGTSGFAIEQIKFADGTTWDLATIKARSLLGTKSNDSICGFAGNDLLQGGDGNDVLTDTSGTALFNGGDGIDTLTGGASSELYIGGTGNDTLCTGAGNDIILFNKGDGQDLFAAGGTGSDTVSLGGGIAYDDLAFSKSGNNLVLTTGDGDQITFQNWYAATPSKPVVDLQVIADAMTDFDAGGADPLRDQAVEHFDFAGVVGAFDAARTANPGLTRWALTNALLDFQLAGSDSAAIGGDLAYQYGKNGTLAGIGVTAAQEVIGASSFGSQAQTLQPLATLQTGTARLS